jgi:hypothetical protein
MIGKVKVTSDWTQAMCPHCGACWPYAELVNALPIHNRIPVHYHDRRECPGTGQHPRNPESDRRPLWNGELPPCIS